MHTMCPYFCSVVQNIIFMSKKKKTTYHPRLEYVNRLQNFRFGLNCMEKNEQLTNLNYDLSISY